MPIAQARLAHLVPPQTLHTVRKRQPHTHAHVSPRGRDANGGWSLKAEGLGGGEGGGWSVGAEGGGGGGPRASCETGCEASGG